MDKPRKNFISLREAFDYIKQTLGNDALKILKAALEDGRLESYGWFGWFPSAANREAEFQKINRGLWKILDADLDLQAIESGVVYPSYHGAESERPHRIERIEVDTVGLKNLIDSLNKIIPPEKPVDADKEPTAPIENFETKVSSNKQEARINQNRRGPRPTKTNKLINTFEEQINNGSMTMDKLSNMKEIVGEKIYNVSRDTFRKARCKFINSQNSTIID